MDEKGSKKEISVGRGLVYQRLKSFHFELCDEIAGVAVEFRGARQARGRVMNDHQRQMAQVIVAPLSVVSLVPRVFWRIRGRSRGW
jgi:hypothetical protein